ncbi:hypothetical protein [Nocardioides ultimimeridianus]
MSESFASDLSGFEAVYRRHVDFVRTGDVKAVLADMDPAVVPAVFEGVRTPRAQVTATDIREIRLDDGRGIGRCVYTTEDGAIGLESAWRHDGTSWLADGLANFEV